MNLLIADDSTVVRERLAQMLTGVAGIEIVGQAWVVSEALESIRALRPEVVILDIEMRGGSGIDVLREVKRTYPSIVAIMFTNHVDPQYKRRCAALGADYFLCKSTDAGLLIEIVEQLARGR